MVCYNIEGDYYTMKKKKILNNIYKFLFIIYLLITTILLLVISIINILPKKYLLPLWIIYLFFTIIALLVIWRKKVKLKLKGCFSIIILFIIAISCLCLIYLNSTFHVLEKIQAKNYQFLNYNIVVLNTSNYKTIEDLENKIIGFYDASDENYQDIAKQLSNIIHHTKKEYNDYLNACKSLLSGDIKALLISDFDLSMVEQEIYDFESQIKIIKSFSIKVNVTIESKKVNITEEPFNIYISGIDIYGDIASISRSDVNMVVSVNPTTNKILFISIPRDYYVQLYNTNGYKDKLTHAGLYGIDTSIKTIENLLDININYYIRVNFTTLVKLVDAIDGIDVYSEYSFKTISGYSFIKGINHMDGNEALAFSRERKAFANGDRQRGENQQRVIEAILDKTLSSKTLIMKYTKILNSLSASFQTNINSDEIYELVNKQIDQMPKWGFESYSLDGFDSFNYTYSYKGKKLYVMEPDQETIEEAKIKIQNIFN